MNEFLTTVVMRNIKKRIFPSQFYFTFVIGICLILLFLYRRMDIISMFIFCLGFVLIYNNLLRIRYWNHIKRYDGILIPVKVIDKVNYDSCRAAEFKHRYSYFVLQKSNGETVDRRVRYMKQFYSIEKNESCMMISATGITKFFTFKELGISYELSNDVVTEQHMDERVLTPMGLGVLKNAILSEDGSLYNCMVHIDGKECYLSSDLIWLVN